jgi:hypothetical protein
MKLSNRLRLTDETLAPAPKQADSLYTSDLALLYAEYYNDDETDTKADEKETSSGEKEDANGNESNKNTAGKGSLE